jgi:hypothetical protein
MIFVGLHGSKRSGTGSKLMGPIAVMLLAAIHPAVSVLRFVWKSEYIVFD